MSYPLPSFGYLLSKFWQALYISGTSEVLQFYFGRQLGLLQVWYCIKQTVAVSHALSVISLHKLFQHKLLHSKTEVIPLSRAVYYILLGM